MYRTQYDAYFERNADPDYQRADADANVVLIQNVGLIAGGFVSLTESESFAVEYWPLELYKLSLRPPPGELQGQVAFVTGAAGGIGRAVVEKLAAAGACVVGFDIDAAGVVEAVEALGERGVSVAGAVTTEAGVSDAFAVAVATFGGVDIVVSNAGLASSAPIEETTLADWERIHAVLSTGYFLVARSAFSLLHKQGRGGTIIVIGSKNALVAGPNATAYSAAKAAEVHLARCLAEEGGPNGVRVNIVNPDAVIEGSRIWNSSWREERAAAYNIEPAELAAYYRDRTTLRVNVLPEDVAQAVLHFASPGRAGKTTGNILNVDGGIRAGYPR